MKQVEEKEQIEKSEEDKRKQAVFKRNKLMKMELLQ